MNIGSILGLVPAIFGAISALINLFHGSTIDWNALGTQLVAIATGLGIVHTSNTAASATLVANAAQAATTTVKSLVANPSSTGERSKG